MRGLPLQHLVLAVLMAIGLTGALPGTALADGLPQPSGQVVLTIGGKIGKTNRAPSDGFDDAYLNNQELGFDKAAAFDLAMLEALGTQTIKLGFESWPKEYRFEGPWLRDLLAAVGAEGKTVRAFALDGYAVEIPVKELESRAWMVALKRDGQYLGLGSRGPLWLLYRLPDGQTPTADDEARWVWATYYIEVE